MTQVFPFQKFLKNPSPSLNKVKNTPSSLKEKKISMNLPSPLFSSENEHKENKEKGEFEICPFKPITQAIFEQLKVLIPTKEYETFIKNKIKVKDLNDKKVIFSAQTPFILNTVESNLLPQIKQILRELMGESYSVEFQLQEQESEVSSLNNLKNIIDSSSLPPKKKKPHQKSSFTLELSPTKKDLQNKAKSIYINHMSEGPNTKQINPNKTFDTFVVGPSNNLAFATACAVADDPGKKGKYPCLYYYSDSGLGKTHLLHAVANGILDKNPELRICLISARDFMKELINAFKDKKISEFQIKYTEYVDVLMIDDIHELKDRKSTQEEFFHIFNFLHDKGKQLIFTSDKSPDKITGIEERIITRLQWGLVIDIQKPDFETRTAILKKKAIGLDLFIQDDLLNLIASSIKSSIRELEGSLIKLQAHAELIQTEIDSEMVKDLLKLQENEGKPAATLESVCRAASHYFKIAVSDLRSKTRNKDIVRARDIAWYLSKNIIGATYQEIGRYYGNRDHTSVIHGVSKITKKLKNDPLISKDIVYLENNI